MPELPDVTVYIEALEARILGHELQRIELVNPFLLRSVSPTVGEALGRRVRSVRRLGKRIAIGLDGDLWLVVHLMIAGRLNWTAASDRARRHGAVQARFRFDSGELLLTEAGSKRRAALHVVASTSGLRAFDRGGLDVAGATPAQFTARMTAENHTLKRALTDPAIVSGIGNAYSDEILHRARLSPTALTQRLDDSEMARLFDAVRSVLDEWTTRLRRECEGRFPERVTAFREGMAVHGRFRQPCPVCGTAVQRIRYADSETNYCPRCQTGGRLLSDRALARLLKSDWPRSIDELEQRQPARDP